MIEKHKTLPGGRRGAIERARLEARRRQQAEEPRAARAPWKPGEAKLKPETALAIYRADGTQKEISRRFGVPVSTVAAIRQGRSWRAVTGHAG